MKRSVLIVDDEPNILLSLEFLMRKAGYAVRVAHDGDEALRLIEENAPDLVLLGVGLPKRNGYDVCQTLRADPRRKGIRIVMVTARARDVERDKGFAMGADDYIIKPFSTRMLTERVARLMDMGGPEHG